MQLRTLLDRLDEIAQQQPDSEDPLPQDDPASADAGDQTSPDDQAQDDTESDGVNPTIQEFIDVAGNMGDDLYSLTGWNYGEIFSGAEDVTADSALMNKIRAVAASDPKNQAAYQRYRGVKSRSIWQDRAYSNVILNARNGALMSFSSDYNTGSNIDGSTNVDGLAQAGRVDQDQLAKLRQLLAAGQKYADAMGSDSQWEPGGGVSRAVDKAEDRLNTILDSGAIKYSEPEIDPVEAERLRKSYERVQANNKIYRELVQKYFPEYDLNDFHQEEEAYYQLDRMLEKQRREQRAKEKQDRENPLGREKR